MLTSKKTHPAASLKWFARTDPGKVRPNNEDAFTGLQFDAKEVHHLGRLGESSTRNADIAFAVSDGMGGAKAGEFASRVAVEKITTLLPRSYRHAAVRTEAGYAEVINNLFHQIHRALTRLGNSDEECAGMEATLSLCWFSQAKMYFGHIGDSRIYHLPASQTAIQQISHDDTHVGWLKRHGHISEREAHTHPRRNVLQKALGAGNQFVTPQFGSISCHPGDIVLLCTDGLVESLYDNRLLETLRPAHPAASVNPANQLVDEALARGARDNTTALVIHIH